MTEWNMGKVTGSWEKLQIVSWDKGKSVIMDRLLHKVDFIVLMFRRAIVVSHPFCSHFG